MVQLDHPRFPNDDAVAVNPTVNLERLEAGSHMVAIELKRELEE